MTKTERTELLAHVANMEKNLAIAETQPSLREAALRALHDNFQMLKQWAEETDCCT